jgi:hypothetical protein
MIKAVARVTLLACLFSLSVSAHFLKNDYLITPKATAVLDQISNELTEKTGITVYAVATTEKLKEGLNLYNYVKQFESKESKPNIILIFAPSAIIKKGMSQTGRLGLIPSSAALKDTYVSSDVLQYFHAFIGSKDSNSLQSKYDVAMLQAYSELADELAAYKGVKLESTLKDNSSWIVTFFAWIVRIGAVLLFWIYFGRPLYRRIKYGKR